MCELCANLDSKQLVLCRLYSTSESVLGYKVLSCDCLAPQSKNASLAQS